MWRLNVILDDFENIFVGDGFLKVINSAHLHRFEVAFHIHTASQDDGGQVAVEFQDAFQDGSPFEGMTSLLHQNEIITFICQELRTLHG